MDEEPKAPENENVNPAPEPAPEQPAQEPAPAPAEAPPAPEAPTAPAAALPNVPDQWPGGFGAYKFSKQAVKFNLSTIVILWVINALVSGGSETILKRSGGLASLVLGTLFTSALVLTYLAGARNQKLEIGEALSKAVAYWLKMIGLSLLVIVSLAVSAILLFVPFLFVLPRLTLASYFLIDKNMGVIEAYKASWAATKGHAMQAWGIILANIAMALLMVTIIGIPFAIYFLIMYSAAFAVFYEFLNKHLPAIAASPVTPAPEAPAPPQAA